MTENSNNHSPDNTESSDESLLRTYTQVASFAGDEGVVDANRQSLREKLEREKLERNAQSKSLLGMIRNLFRAG